MKPRNRTVVAVGLALAQALFSGCAVPTYRVEGKVTREGKPLEWKSDPHELLVLFVPMDREKNKETYRAEVNTEAGTYVIDAIPAGTYRVSVQQMDPYPKGDLLNFAFSLKDSPLSCTIAGDMVFDIDLPKNLPPMARPAMPAGRPEQGVDPPGP